MIFIILTFFNLTTEKNRKDPTDALLKAAVLFALYLYAATEILSLFRVCTRTSILIVWLAADLCLILRLIAGRQGGNTLHIIKGSFRSFFYGKYAPVRIGFLAFFFVMFVMAYLTVPYNWDSMTYHLTRMAIWVQNASVAHYPAVDARELSTPPLTEFVMMHLYLLCGKNDLLLNMVQFLSYVFNTYMIYRISRRLGLDCASSYFASFLFVSVPVAFAEAVTTQVDEFAAVWLMIFVYYGIGLIKEDRLEAERTHLENTIVMGLCIGLGYLSKPTVIPVMMIFTFWIILNRVLHRDKAAYLIRLFCAAFISALAVVLPEIIKNIQSFGAVLAPSTGQRQLIGTLRPNYVFINFLKNAAYDLANPYLYAFGYRTQKMIYGAAAFMNVKINDPSISEDGKIFEMGFSQIYDHDSSTNFVIVTLIFLMAVLAVARLVRSEKGKKAGVKNMYALIAFLSFTVMMTIIRWEPFMNRYMLPVFAVCCPGIASVTEPGKTAPGRYVRPVAVFLCALELFSLFNYHGKIIMDQMRMNEREKGYYTKNEEAYDRYEMVKTYVTKEAPGTMGMIASKEAFKYPVWNLFNRSGVKGLIIIPEDGMEGDGRQPDAIVVMGVKMGDSFEYAGREYKRLERDGKKSVIFR